MDPVLIERTRAITPKFNPTVANGVAYEQMMSKDPETGDMMTMVYANRLIRITSELFPEGLVYKGSRMCSPEKHLEEITREYNSKRQANIARSDTYLIELAFEYKGEPCLPRYVLLPFVRPGGLMMLNGGLYSTSPVMADVGYSAGTNSLFVPLRRARLTFNTVDYGFYVNGEHSITYIIWSAIHNKISDRKKQDYNNRREIHSSLIHYFFCKHGIVEAFKVRGDVDIQIGLKTQFDPKKYPPSKWLIFESRQLSGRHPTGEMVLVMPVAQDGVLPRMMVGAFFYVVDTFPDGFSNYLELLFHPDGSPIIGGDITLWRQLLGNIVYGDYEHVGKMLENIDTHIRTVDTYLDEITRDDLKSVEVHVNDFWDLLYAILTQLFHHFYSTNDEATVYFKRLMVLRYVMEEFNSAVSRFAFTFQSRRDKLWSIDDINDQLKAHFKPRTAIKELSKSHGEMDSVNYPGTNKVARITSMLVPQDSARANRSYRKTILSDTSRILHASLIEVCQITNQPKTYPDGRGRINMFVKLDADYTVQRKKEYRKLIDEIQRRISRS